MVELSDDYRRAINKAEKEYYESYKSQVPNFITIEIVTPTSFDFDINEVLYLLKYTDSTNIQDEELLDSIIDTCIGKAIAGYDDIYYYSFGEEEYNLVRDEVKKYLYTQLNLGI